MGPRRLIRFLLAAALCCGCTARSPIGWPDRQMTSLERQFEAAWIATQLVLRDYGFTLDRVDRRATLITTEPLAGRHFFEVWRKDTVSTDDLAESSLHKIYRSVEVRIAPSQEKPGTYRPQVKVVVGRAVAGPKRTITTADAYGMFRQPLEEMVAAPTDKQPKLEPLPADLLLADRLTLEIRAATVDILDRNPE